MQNNNSTSQIIGEFILTVCGPEDARRSHLLMHMLHTLVLQAKAEKAIEMKTSMCFRKKSSGSATSRQLARILLESLVSRGRSGQAEFDFHRSVAND